MQDQVTDLTDILLNCRYLIISHKIKHRHIICIVTDGVLFLAGLLLLFTSPLFKESCCKIEIRSVFWSSWQRQETMKSSLALNAFLALLQNLGIFAVCCTKQDYWAVFCPSQSPVMQCTTGPPTVNFKKAKKQKRKGAGQLEMLSDLWMFWLLAKSTMRWE